MHFLVSFFCLFIGYSVHAATIAIIDTGFDLDHEFLKPRIISQESGPESELSDWNFNDNSHLKHAVIESKSEISEVLLFRNLRAKSHRDQLTANESEWFKRKNSDKSFMEKVRKFKKHSHGTFVASIALREGENIRLLPVRGLNIPIPIQKTSKATSAEEKFKEEINYSIERVTHKFSKICQHLAKNNVNIVNASYGITYKSISNKFRDKYKELTKQDIQEGPLQILVEYYFQELFRKTRLIIKNYPKMLFVFSAGNSTLDNDLNHHYPSKIKLPNTISVAAMNGDYLASFSNFGLHTVDIGAPGVAILSLVPKVYSDDGVELYSPASGTSMAAPYISNLAAQILNTNSLLTSDKIKKIILETGDKKDHLKQKLLSSALANNQRALKAAILSREMSLDEAINLSKSDLIPLEDTISFGIAPAVAAESIQKKVMESIPQIISSEDLDEEPSLNTETTKPLFLPQKNLGKVQPDKKVRPVSIAPDDQQKSSDPNPSSQKLEQSQKPSEDLPASSSEVEPKPLQTQPLESAPSSPQ